MSKQNNKKIEIFIGILLIIVILICAIFIQKNYQSVENSSEVYEYLDIDSSKLNIFYFNVGQADCTLVTINNKNLLIDAGNKSDGQHIVEFLKKYNFDTIDYFVITHGDLDHSGGAKFVLDNCKINNLFMQEGIEDAEENYNEVKRLAEEWNIAISKVEIGDKFNLDMANFEILSVKNNSNNSANESSIVIKLGYLDTNYLFMGDATKKIIFI